GVDLAIQKSITPTTPALNQPLTYTLTFSSVGNQIAANVVITDQIPVSLTNVNYSSNKVITPTGGSNYVWQVEDLSPGETGLITVTARYPGGPISIGFITNTATISSSAYETYQANNMATTVTRNPNAPLTVADVYTAFINIPLNVAAPGVLSNDSDPNNDPLTVFLISNPLSGSIQLNVNGGFVYTPSLDFTGVETFTYRAIDNGSSLVGYWPFDEGSGLTTLDVSGNDHTGNLLNGATFSPVVPFSQNNPYALDLDGNNDYVQTSGAINLANQSFSIAMWAKRASTGTDDYIVTHGSASPNNGLHFGFRNNNVFTCAFYANDLDTPATYTDNNWHHWACTYNAATKQRVIYQDGIAVASDTASTNYQGNGVVYFGSTFGSAN
ncbi:MAG: DUF11 domain-containing protein, partial [Oceanicoccus sp.]|uniref:LamG-like jellyroll fold domain-containing protein n=1 Tax=Oceanicoccus sp. TaxID=2691044 RepID=UPI002611A342